MSSADERGGRMHAFSGNSFDDYYDHDIREHPLPGRLLIGAVVRILWVITKFLWPWRIENAELLTNDPRGRVIAGVPVRTVYKGDFDKILPATWLFSRAGGFPVQRGTADMKTVRRARAMLMRGESVLIYPEGTRVRNDADQEAHGGYAIMAQLAKAPVYVRAEKPIEWSEIGAEKRKEQLAEMERIGMARVYALRDQLREDYPGVD